MTQPSRGGSQSPQMIVFLVLLALLLGGLIVGSRAGVSSAPAATEAATPEATAAATEAATAESTAAATSAATEAATAAATSAATAEATAETTVTATEAATAEATTAAVAPRVFFVSPADGATVPTTFTVQMGAEGLTVEPAGDVHANAGHFHILVDAPFIAAGEVIPKDATHLHFGQAQTSADLTLTPGDHILRLQFANGAHVALDGDQYRAEIHVTVQ